MFVGLMSFPSYMYPIIIIWLIISFLLFYMCKSKASILVLLFPLIYKSDYNLILLLVMISSCSVISLGGSEAHMSGCPCGVCTYWVCVAMKVGLTA